MMSSPSTAALQSYERNDQTETNLTSSVNVETPAPLV